MTDTSWAGGWTWAREEGVSTKIVVIASLVIVSFLVTYLDLGHSGFLYIYLYYIPIILVALWFPRRLFTFTVMLATAFLAILTTFTLWGYLIDPFLSALYVGTFFWVLGAMTAINRQAVPSYMQTVSGSRPFQGAHMTYDPASGKIITCSRRFAQMLGYVASDLEGLPEQGLWVDPAERDLFHRLAEDTPDGVTDEVTLRSRGGSEKKITLTSQGNVRTGLVTLTVESCTLPSRRAEVHDDGGRQPVDTGAPFNLVAMQDLKGSLLHFQWDRAVEFGFDPASMIGKGMDTMLPPGASEYHEKSVQQVLETGGTVRYDLMFSAGEAETLLSLSLSPVYDARGSVIGIITTGRDLNVGSRKTETFSHEEMQERWKGYITTFAHELRTPLQPILGYLCILRDDAVGQGISEEGVQYLEHCITYLQTEQQIIDRMLEFSLASTECASMHREEFSLNELISTVLTEGGYTRMAEITVFVPRDTMISADPERMHYVVNSLISNAVRYNREPRHVKIAYRQTDGTHYLMVSDNGNGIDADQLRSIFDAYHLADGNRTNRECGRMGLALPVAREYVAHHGGTITVTSCVGEGSTFTVHLPKEEMNDT